MFKFGIYSIRQLEKGKTQTILGTAKKVSVTLLDKIDELGLDSSAYESIMFYLNDDRGACKRTYEARFEDFDDKCIETISRTIQRSALRFHDVAVSSGETAVELFEKLRQTYTELSYLASDYDPSLTVINQGPLSVSIASFGSIVEITLPPFVFSHNPPDRWFYPINRFLFFVTREFWAKPLVKKFQIGMLSGQKVKNIRLFCSKAKQLEKRDSRFKLGQHDLLSSKVDRFDCLRAMNVLNNSYFSTNQIQNVLLNVYDSLSENGLFIVGSNQDPGTPVSGAVYVKKNGRFDRAWATTSAPQIAEHILRFNSRSNRGSSQKSARPNL